MCTPASVNLGPGALQPQPGSPFFLAGADWDAIQQYVNAGLNLNYITGDLSALHLTDALVTVKSIISNCNNWNQIYYPETVALAGMIANFAANVPAAYQGLESVVSTGTATQDIQIAIAALQAAASEYSTSSAKALSDLQAFDAFCTQTTNQLSDLLSPYIPSGSPIWKFLQGVFNLPPVSTLETGVGMSVGVWSALNNDLTFVGSVLTNAQTASADLAGLDLTAAISDWQNVGEEASAFAAGASKTQAAAD